MRSVKKIASFYLSRSGDGTLQSVRSVSLSSLADAFSDISGAAPSAATTELGAAAASLSSDHFLKRTTQHIHVRPRPNSMHFSDLSDAQLHDKIVLCASRKLLDVIPSLLLELLVRLESQDPKPLPVMPAAVLLSVLKMLFFCPPSYLEIEMQKQQDHELQCSSCMGSLLRFVCRAAREQASEWSYVESIEFIHLWNRCDIGEVDGVIETVVDNIRHSIQCSDHSVLQNERIGQELDSLSLLLDSMAQRCSSLVFSNVQPELRSSSAWLSVVAGVLQVQHDPLACEDVFIMATNRIATLLSSQEHIGGSSQQVPSSCVVSSKTLFFIMRSIALLPWVNTSCVSSLLCISAPHLKRDASSVMGIVVLLGRQDVDVTDVALVLNVLDVLLDDLKQCARRRRENHHARVRFMEWHRLSKWLPRVHHMLQTAIQQSLRRGEQSPESNAQMELKDLQTKSKTLYWTLCDDLLDSLGSVQELCTVRVIDNVLHHFVCLAPRKVVEHPLICHLAFALTQTAPSLSVISNASKERLHDVIERLQEAEVFNDVFQMPFTIIKQHALIRSAVVSVLKFKRKGYLYRLAKMHSKTAADVQAAQQDVIEIDETSSDEELERAAQIVFVAFRRLLRSWQ